MKKLALIVAAVAVLALAGWSALWLFGRDRIEERLDQEIARLSAQGFEISHGERRVEGFPFAYEVTYDDVSVSDPASGISYALPSVTGVATAEDVGRVTFRLPPAFTASVRFDEAMREAYDELPEAMLVEIEADGLVIETAAPDAAVMHLETRAGSVLAVSAGEGTPVALAVEMVELEGELTVPREPGVGTVSGRTTIEKLDYAISLLDPDGQRTTVEGMSDDLMLSGETSMRTPEQWEALFTSAEAEGSADFAYQVGESVSQIRVEGGDALAGTLRQEAGTGGGVVRIGDGRIELRGSSENNRYAFTPAEETEDALAGGVVLDSFEMVYLAPIAPSDEMTAFEMRLALIGLEGDEALWEALDPDGRLERGPANLILEVRGTGRMKAPDAEGLPADRPVELGNLEIVVASLQALGASVSAEGALEFRQPMNLPEGTVTVTAKNLLDVLDDLAAAGMLDEGLYQMAVLMSSVYARPGEAEGELVADVEFTLDGLLVNGQPIE